MVIESLAAGTPVLISDQVNICHEVEQAGVGWVCPAKVTAFATCLDDLLNHPRKRLAAAENARSFVSLNYDWDTIARAWRSQYDALIGSSRRQDK